MTDSSFGQRALTRLEPAARRAGRFVNGGLLVLLTLLVFLDAVLASSVSSSSVSVQSSGDPTFIAPSLSGREWMSVGVVVLAIIAVVVMALRRRFLVVGVGILAVASASLTLVAVADGPIGAPSLTVLVTVSLLSTFALRTEPARVAAIVTVAGALIVVSECLRLRDPGTSLLLMLCGFAFAVWVGIGVYLRWINWSRDAAASTARAEERVELARELHDLVGHYVTGMIVQAQAARFVAEHNPTAAAAALEGIEAAGADAMAAIRRMVGELRDDARLTPGGSWDELDDLLASAASRGEPVRGRIDPAARTEPALAASVCRLVAESLTNVKKHGTEVTAVDVDVSRVDRSIVVSVLDDGQSRGTARPDSFGIIGMRERAEALGGTLHAGPAAGGGWLVRAELPAEPRGARP